MNVAMFEEWMVGQGYRETSIRKTLQQLMQVREAIASEAPIPDYTRDSIRRYLRYAEERNSTAAFAVALRERGYQAARIGVSHKPRGRKQVARSFDDNDWRALAMDIANDDTAEGAVLVVMMASGLRIGDVLRLKRKQLEEGLKTGVINLERKGGRVVPHVVEGIEDAWQKLLKVFGRVPYPAQNVAELVCPDNPDPVAGSCAYQRVNRRLKRHGQNNGTAGRVHLHRMRRTIAIQALRETKDIGAVQQLLGHASPVSTQHYLDEHRAQDVAALQRKLKKKYNIN